MKALHPVFKQPTPALRSIPNSQGPRRCATGLAKAGIGRFRAGQITASRRMCPLIVDQVLFGRQGKVAGESIKRRRQAGAFGKARALEGTRVKGRSQKGLQKSPLFDMHKIVHGQLRGDAVQSRPALMVRAPEALEEEFITNRKRRLRLRRSLEEGGRACCRPVGPESNPEHRG